MELPEWVDIVKTARFKELPPYDPDWYYTRAGEGSCFFTKIIYKLLLSRFCTYMGFLFFFSPAASIARKIYLRQGIGVGGFQKIYGGRQRNGSRPPHFCKSSGAISRNILQQLQKMGIIDVDPKG
jgi:small subunit ribosomal protein S19e